MLFIVLLLPLSGILGQKSKSPIQVLLISGKNNHEWKKTSPAFRQILEENGFFKVDITERPDTLKASVLKNYQVIASNWNAFPESTRKWGEVAEKAIVDFVNRGGGFVLFHSASAAHYDWPEYQQMVGATWGKNTHHRQIAPFEVKIQNTKHLVTKGMINFVITDELWVEMDQQPGNEVLCSAFAPSSNKGRDQDEPVLICRNQGKGHCFYLVLGHDVAAMQNIGWKTLMQRGTEWAATGKVTQKLPQELSLADQAKRLSWKEEPNSLALTNNEQVVWQFNFSKAEGKPYFHPLSTLNGCVLTELRPADHLWHRGIWFSWKFINGLNYWEEDPASGQSEGITELKRVTVKKNKIFEAEFQLKLVYHPLNKPDVLEENRLVTLSSPADDGSYFIQWKSRFTAIADEVVLDRTPLPHEPNGQSWGGYAGFSARLNNQFQEVAAINDKGTIEKMSGNQSRWMTFEMKKPNSDLVAVTIFDHPENRNYPNKWYITVSPQIPFYYFSPALLYDSKLVLKKGEILNLKYMLLVNSGKSTVARLQTYWENFTNQNK